MLTFFLVLTGTIIRSGRPYPPPIPENASRRDPSKEAAPETPVILTVHELKRLARDAAELMALSAELQVGGIQLELLTGPLTGIYDPNGMGAMLFAVFAVAGQIELREQPQPHSNAEAAGSLTNSDARNPRVREI